MKKPASKPELGGSVKDRRIVQLEDQLASAKRSLRAAHRRALDDDAIRELLGTIKMAKCSPPTWMVDTRRRKAGSTPEVPMTSFADWHGGEVVSRSALNGVNEYSLSIMDARIRRLVERIIHLCKEYGPGSYPGIVVNIVGDLVSGGLHPELLKTDELEVIPAALHVRDLIVWALQTLADHFGLVYAPAVCGNHGRGTPKPEFKRYIYKNFDWLIIEMVKRALADRGDDRITIDVRDSNEVYYRVWDMRFLLMHGDMLGVKGGDGIIGAIGPIMRGEVKTRGYADTAGMPYDHMEMGHWHQELWLPRATVANTLKGYCEYAKNALRAPISEPSQPLKFIHPRYGITSRWNVRVNPGQKAVRAEEWISWKVAA
jgi:hypothetical protein